MLANGVIFNIYVGMQNAHPPNYNGPIVNRCVDVGMVTTYTHIAHIDILHEMLSGYFAI